METCSGLRVSRNTKSRSVMRVIAGTTAASALDRSFRASLQPPVEPQHPTATPVAGIVTEKGSESLVGVIFSEF